MLDHQLGFKLLTDTSNLSAVIPPAGPEAFSATKKRMPVAFLLE